MKIALVHDWLVRLGGAERVLIALHRIFPEASIHTLFYDRSFTDRHLPGAEIRSSFLQKVPNIKKTYPWFKIFMPVAIESLDLSGFDLVISSSHEVAHGVIVKPGTRHLAYYHSPSRLLWDRTHEYLEDFRKRKNDPVKLSLIRAGQHLLRLWDWSAGKRPDVMVANSKHVAQRIKKYYDREARIVYPPVAVPEHLSRSFSAAPAAASEGVGRFVPPVAGTEPKRPPTRSTNIPARLLENYFLVVSQLYPHKNLELAVQTFKNLPELDLTIIGQGPERRRLKRMIGGSGNIRLLGFVSDEELSGYYRNCLAYLICNEEDFGISPLEAMMHGKPVLALRKGGSMETVIEGKTGEFFDEESGESLAAAVRSIHENIKQGCYDSRKIIEHAQRFGFDRFKKEILAIVNEIR